jgi:hypothetical protein
VVDAGPPLRLHRRSMLKIASQAKPELNRSPEGYEQDPTDPWQVDKAQRSFTGFLASRASVIGGGGPPHGPINGNRVG